MATLSTEQFQTLLATLTQTAQAAPPQQQNPPPAGCDPAALGPMPPCIFGSNKLTRLQKFEAWLEEAQNRMTYIGTTDETKKLILLRSWGGLELVNFMKTHAKIIFEAVPATDSEAEIPIDTYDQAIKKIKDELRKLVNRTMAMYQVFTTKQGDRSWMDYCILKISRTKHLSST